MTSQLFTGQRRKRFTLRRVRATKRWTARRFPAERAGSGRRFHRRDLEGVQLPVLVAD